MSDEQLELLLLKMKLSLHDACRTSDKAKQTECVERYDKAHAAVSAKFAALLDRAEKAETELKALTFHIGSDGKTNTHLAVVLNGDCSNEFAHLIERELKQALLGCGFGYTGTVMGTGRTALHYCQFAVALGGDK